MGMDMDATREVCRDGERSGFRGSNNPPAREEVGSGR
jgi:hypothetical protein